MSSRGVYGNKAGEGDTAGFRRTWDREEYAAKAAEREARDRAEAKARYEAKSSGKKYHGIKSEDGDTKRKFDEDKMIEARRERINVEENLNKITLVPAGAVGRRGKGAGFYCEFCDLTYKNSHEWIEHLNSKQHLHNTGQSDVVKKATLEEVLERLEWLKSKKDEAEKENYDLKQRVAERIKLEEKEAAERKERRKIKREKAKEKKQEEKMQKKKDAEGDVQMDNDTAIMARMMGFGGFGSTKNK